MKHSHTHRHDDGTRHGHFHEHEQDSPLGSTTHQAEPHEHEHHATRVTIPVTFEAGTLDDIGLGGFKVGWIDAEQSGREYSLTAGAGVGSPYLEASVAGPDGQPSVYARADIREAVTALWREMEIIQRRLAAAADGVPAPERGEER